MAFIYDINLPSILIELIDQFINVECVLAMGNSKSVIPNKCPTRCSAHDYITLNHYIQALKDALITL